MKDFVDILLILISSFMSIWLQISINHSKFLSILIRFLEGFFFTINYLLWYYDSKIEKFCFFLLEFIHLYGTVEIID